MIASDFDAMQAEFQALQDRSAEVRPVEAELAPPVATELHATHEAVADLNCGVDHQRESLQFTPPENFAENPLVVDDQRNATHRSVMSASQ